MTENFYHLVSVGVVGVFVVVRLMSALWACSFRLSETIVMSLSASGVQLLH